MCYCRTASTNGAHWCLSFHGARELTYIYCIYMDVLARAKTWRNDPEDLYLLSGENGKIREYCNMRRLIVWLIFLRHDPFDLIFSRAEIYVRWTLASMIETRILGEWGCGSWQVWGSHVWGFRVAWGWALSERISWYVPCGDRCLIVEQAGGDQKGVYEVLQDWSGFAGWALCVWVILETQNGCKLWLRRAFSAFSELGAIYIGVK